MTCDENHEDEIEQLTNEIDQLEKRVMAQQDQIETLELDNERQAEKIDRTVSALEDAVRDLEG